MRSLALLEPSHPAMRQKDNLPALQDGEAEVERLIKQADELKAEKQRLMSEVVQTQRQVSCDALTYSRLVTSLP